VISILKVVAQHLVILVVN
jgi:hypothetical protein